MVIQKTTQSFLRIGLHKSKQYFFWGFIFIYALFLLFLCNEMSIWVDEAYTLNTTANSLSKVVHLSYQFEGQPPVYFVILALWRKFNNGIFFARSLSVLFTFLSAYVLNKLLKLIFEKIYTKWVIILFLINPVTIHAGLEIRLYSFLILLSVTLIYLFYLIYYYNHTSHKILFIIIGVLGVYTQYYFVFLIISLTLIILIRRSWRLFFNFCLWCLPIAE